MLRAAATSSISRRLRPFSLVPLMMSNGARAVNVRRLSGADGSLASLSVGELKQLLSERGVDFRDCLEKRDLTKRLTETASQRKVAGSSSRPLDLTPTEMRTVETFQRVSPSVACACDAIPNPRPALPWWQRRRPA